MQIPYPIIFSVFLIDILEEFKPQNNWKNMQALY